MIERILEVKGLGVLEDALAGRPLELGQSTVIYGENGRGKSLLTALFRSLRPGDAAHLKPRETLSSDEGLGALLAINGNPYELRGFRWHPEAYSDIEVFDAQFINQNVHAGDAVDAVHRQNLCQFVMGSEGVEVAQRIDELNRESRELARRLSDGECQLEGILGGVLSLDRFLSLENDPTVRGRIERAEVARYAAEEADQILSGEELQPIALPFPPPPHLLAPLSESCDLASPDAEMVAKHIAAHLSEKGEAWLKSGVGQMSGDRCPFCGQTTVGNQLVAALRSYFSGQHSTFHRRIEVAKQAACDFYSDSKLWSLAEILNDNQRRVLLWSRYLPIAEPKSPLPQIQSVWADFHGRITEAFERKLANPREVWEADRVTQGAAGSLSEARVAVEAYNGQVVAINDAIRRKQADTEGLDPRLAEAQLARLQLQEKRWQPGVASLCDLVVALRRQKVQVQNQKAALRAELDEHVRRFASHYEATLNEFLAQCDANFRLCSFGTAYHGGTARSDYRILLFGQKISPSAKPSAKPHFATALSEGDRQTLALAFFLARMKRDADLRHKILVLDDPICSLGPHRRSVVATAVSEMAAICRQLILLTHDPEFAAMCARKLGAAYISSGRSLRTICIERSGPWSVILPRDPRDFQDLSTIT